MIMSYVIGIGCSFILAGLIAYFWVRGIHNMKEKHPDYKGEDLFDEWDNIHSEGDF